jgi:HEAT repeat protein
MPSEVHDFLVAASSDDALASLRELPRYRVRLQAGLASALASAEPSERAPLQAWFDRLASLPADARNADEDASVAPLPDFDARIGLAALRTADPLVRAEAANRLGRSHAVEALEPLLSALNDPDALVRASAAQALGHLGRPEAVPALIAALDDSDPEVRSLAAYSLGLLHATPAVSALIAATADASRSVRTSAGLALAQIGEPAVAPLLGLYAAGEPDRAQLPLRVMQPAELIEPLLSALSSGSTPLRAAAAEQLIRFHEPRVRTALHRALNDPDERVRHLAGVALDVQERQSDQTNGSTQTHAPS